MRVALKNLLGGALGDMRLESGTVILLAAAPPGPDALPAPEPVDLEKQVIKRARKDYRAPGPSPSLRIAAPLLETPQSIVGT